MSEAITFLTSRRVLGTWDLEALAGLLVALSIGTILSYLLRWHYIRFGNAFADRRAFSRNFVTITLAVTLIIAIIKGSMALSLGLVGALSIVRFRTPIKDPEELTYLFLCVALGIGLGAKRLLFTSAAFGFILLVMAIRGRARQGLGRASMFLEIDIAGPAGTATTLAEIAALVQETFTHSQPRRFEARATGVVASFSVVREDGGRVAELTQTVQQRWPEAGITLLDPEHELGA
ncbi:MAG: DUF4956 domain-containing protein [Planctomycetota bacterium]|jgi:hypothetical protein